MSKRARTRARSPGARKPDGRKRTSPANGAKGGRPRDRLPTEVVARLNMLPCATPKEIRLWNANLLVEVQKLSLEGKITTELASSLRANAGSIDRALPAEPPPRPVDDEDDDEESDGPDLAEDDEEDSLRVG